VGDGRHDARGDGHPLTVVLSGTVVASGTVVVSGRMDCRRIGVLARQVAVCSQHARLT
jgi:hypothetical protein